MIRRSRSTPESLRMAEIADDIDVVAIRIQRLKDLCELETGTLLCRSPLVHGGPMGKVDRAESRSGIRCGLRLGRGCRNHGFQEGQRHGNAHS